MKSRKPREHTCPNPNCEHFGKEYAMNLVVISTYRVYNGQLTRKMFQCDCGATFSETTGCFYYRRKNKEEYYNQILDGAIKQLGLRSSAELFHISKDTPTDVYRSVGMLIKQWAMNTYIVLPQGNIEYDEFWTFVKVKKSDGDIGEMWVWIAFHRETRFMINFVVGKHTTENGYELVENTKDMIEHPCKHSTDGLISYEKIFAKVYSDNITNPDLDKENTQQHLPFPKVPKELQYGQVIKTLEKGKITKVEKKSIFGGMDENDISTSLIERLNLTIRQSLIRCSRKTMKFSKSLSVLESMIWIFWFHYNFMKPHKSLRKRLPKDKQINRRIWAKRTPAMEAGICDKILDWSIPLTLKSGFG